MSDQQQDQPVRDQPVTDSGMSEDVENSLTAQGVSDRETTAEIGREAGDDGEGGLELGQGGSGTGM